jgi:hypothetical protein
VPEVLDLLPHCPFIQLFVIAQFKLNESLHIDYPGHGHGAHSLHAPPKPRMQLVEAEQVFDRPFLNILGVSAGAAFVFYHLIAIPFLYLPFPHTGLMSASLMPRHALTVMWMVLHLARAVTSLQRRSWHRTSTKANLQCSTKKGTNKTCF